MKSLLAVGIILTLAAAQAPPVQAKKKPGPKACKPFSPGEIGDDASHVIVTEEHTEGSPFEVPASFDPSLTFGFPTAASHVYVNVQVDSRARESGLNALIEFPTRRDFDLRLLNQEGNLAAESRAFNPLIEVNGTPGISQSGHGGESTDHSEQLVGITTRDCGGWTLEATAWFSEGGDHPIELWLGPAQVEPQS